MSADRYHDRTLDIDAHTLTIRRYYFPWAGAKRVALTSVCAVRRAPLSAFGGRGRLWGSTTLRDWANLDMARPGKDAGFALDLGGRIRPFVTPDDPDAFEAALRAALPGTPFDVVTRPRYGV